MINVVGNLFEQQGWLCITTNGFVKNNGRAVMGAGCAKTARDSFKDIDLVLGSKIKASGNEVHHLGHYGSKQQIWSFPVKHAWWEEADIDLIAKSAKQIRDIYKASQMRTNPNYDVWIPRPGCGNGKLSYKDVEPVLAEILIENNFKIITF